MPPYKGRLAQKKEEELTLSIWMVSLPSTSPWEMFSAWIFLMSVRSLARMLVKSTGCCLPLPPSREVAVTGSMMIVDVVFRFSVFSMKRDTLIFSSSSSFDFFCSL